MLSEQAIKEFQTLCHQVWGEDISFLEAERRAIALLKLYKIVLKPETKQQKKEEKT